jgi:hypothetical protein
MFKGNRKYFFILGLCFVALILLQLLTPKPINWNPTYLKKDKIPFGTSALFEMLPEVFPGQAVNIQTLPAYNSLELQDGPPSNYVVINSTFEPDKLDSRTILDYVAKGNCVFIAATYYTGNFADTFKIKTDSYSGVDNVINLDSSSVAPILGTDDSTEINFVNPLLKRKTAYVYRKGIENTFFESFDTSLTTILGQNSKGHPDFISIRWGKGKIFLSTVPEVYTNYLFVNEKNYDYVYKSLSYLPNQEILWDEYYKAGNVKKENALRVIFSKPDLLAAYYLLMGSILIFITVGIKRKQRIIPVVEPLRNTTLDFVETVGTLYYQAGNHKNIADKKIAYFLEYIRSAFQVKTTLYDDAFIDRITNLSGIERKKIHDLFYYFADISIKGSITEQELQKLNRMIETFHRENKR